MRFIFFSTHVRCVGVHPGQYKSRFGPRSCTNCFSQEIYLFQLLKKPPNGRFRSEILRYIFFSTLVWSLGVHPGQYKSRFGPRSRNFFFLNIIIPFYRQNSCCSESSGAEFFVLYFFLTHLSKKKKSLPERSELQRHYILTSSICGYDSTFSFQIN